MKDKVRRAMREHRTRTLRDEEAARRSVRSLLESMVDYTGPNPSNEQIDKALIEAEAWIARRRWSRLVVAANIIKDGHPHA